MANKSDGFLKSYYAPGGVQRMVPTDVLAGALAGDRLATSRFSALAREAFAAAAERHSGGRASYVADAESSYLASLPALLASHADALPVAYLVSRAQSRLSSARAKSVKRGHVGYYDESEDASDDHVSTHDYAADLAAAGCESLVGQALLEMERSQNITWRRMATFLRARLGDTGARDEVGAWPKHVLRATRNTAVVELVRRMAAIVGPQPWVTDPNPLILACPEWTRSYLTGVYVDGATSYDAGKAAGIPQRRRVIADAYYTLQQWRRTHEVD